MHKKQKQNLTLGSTSAFCVDSYVVEAPDYSVALSLDGMIGITWNRSVERPNGFPHTYSHQQWFILPEPIAQMVKASIALAEENIKETEVGADDAEEAV